MAKKAKKLVSGILALSLCMSAASLPSFATESQEGGELEVTVIISDPVESEVINPDGSVETTVESGKTWTDTDPDDNVTIEGEETKTETSKVDPEGKPLSESGEISGSEVRKEESSEPAAGEGEPQPELPAPEYNLEGEKTFEFERSYNEQGNAEVGGAKTESAELKLNAEGYKEDLEKAYDNSEVTYKDNGDGTTTFTVTQETVTDSDSTTTGNYNVPAKPEVNSASTDANGITSTVVAVEDVTDADGNVIGYKVKTQQTDADGKVISNETRTATGSKTITTTETLITTTNVTANSAENRDITVELGIVQGEAHEIEMTAPQFNDYEAEGEDKKISLIDGDDTLLDPNSEQFQFVGERVFSDYRILGTEEDNSWCRNSLFELVKNGADNEELQKMYAYCTDLHVHTDPGTTYEMTNIDVANYFSVEEGDKLRSIVQNAYWGNDAGDDPANPEAGSLEAVLVMMTDYFNKQSKDGTVEIDVTRYVEFDEDTGYVSYDRKETVALTLEDLKTYLTPGLAISASQATIWRYGNRSEMIVGQNEDGTPIVKNYLENPIGEDGVLHYAGNGISASAEEQAVATLMYQALMALEGTPAKAAETLINEDSITNAKVTLRDDGDDKLEADVSFTMAVIPDQNGNLLVHVREIDADGNFVGDPLVTKRLAGQNAEGETYGSLTPDANNTYTISDITLSNGQKVTLQIAGTQNLDENGVYLFTAQSSLKRNDDGSLFTDENGQHVSETAGQDTKQTLIGRASGSAKVDLRIDLSVKVSESSSSPTRRASATVVKSSEDESEWTCSWEKVYEYPKTEEPKEEPKDEPKDEPEEEPVDEPVEEPEDIPEEPVPLSGDTPLEELPEEPVPLAEVPQTGDNAPLWIMMSLLSGCCLIFLSKKREEA